MGVRITLKPNEGLFLNGVWIKNGERKADLYIQDKCRFLRESEMISEEDAITICKSIWLTLQNYHLKNSPASLHESYQDQIKTLRNKIPAAAEHIEAIDRALCDGNTHKALKEAKFLVQYENNLLRA